LDQDRRVEVRIRTRIGINQYPAATSTSPVSTPPVKPVKLDSNSIFKFLFLNWSCKIDIKSSVSPKITNNISLEYLEDVEFSSTIKPYILWVHFESIIRSESNLRLLNKFITFVLWVQMLQICSLWNPWNI
jgi:hypothetical protein